MPTNIQVVAVSDKEVATVKWETTLTLYSCHSDSSIEIHAYILPKHRQVTGRIPGKCSPLQQWSHIEGLVLADPYYNQSGEIDILLGSDVVPYIMTDGRKIGNNSSPVAQNTIFGWVLSGKASKNNLATIQVNFACCNLESLIHRFWEVEQIPNRKPLTKEEEECEAHFSSTASRQHNGRFLVELPFNEKKDKIGSSRFVALQQFYALERRFKRFPDKRQQYIEFMREYERLGHMQEALPLNQSEPAFYIPHHFVINENSSTTNLRVVFNGSIPSSTGVSLNDALMKGPTIQDDLLTHLIRFRLFLIALKADMAKMFRQFDIVPQHRNYQRIFWRESEHEPVKEYVLLTVTYGTKPATFLAVRCLKELAEKAKEKYNLATVVLLLNMYVDDLIGGAKSTSEAIAIVQQVIALCKSAGLEMRKWASNSKEVLNSIPEELQESSGIHDFDDDQSLKALGIRWNPNGDYFHFTYNLSNSGVLTKAALLSQIGSVFDPVGWLTPVTITARILFQELWREAIDWKDPVSDEIRNMWNQYTHELQHVQQLKIPRCIIPSDPVSYHLYGFSDASEKAMAAAVYLKAVDKQGTPHVHLITSRTKVAPLEPITLPRLELNAAVLLSEVVEAVIPCIPKISSYHMYTDSMITFHWLTSTTRRWKTYVANRVTIIKAVIPSSSWTHVVSEENPADLPSRGIPASQLLNNHFWWHGPSWIANNPSNANLATPSESDEIELTKEEKAKKVITVATTTVNQVTTNYFLAKLTDISVFSKMATTVAWLTRYKFFIMSKHRSAVQIGCLATGPLTAQERTQARNFIIKLIQQDALAEEIKHLIKSSITSPNHPTVQHNSKLKALNPFLDNQSVIRVGGRIQRSQVNFDQRHPIIIPHTHPLLPHTSAIVKALIRDYHERLSHGGFTLVLSSIRRTYWIMGGRSLIRDRISKCVDCRMAKAETAEQQMGILPAPRVTRHRPFLHCGVDFAGPFQIKMRAGRGAPTDKCYMAVFVCLATKACHLEAVTGLSTNKFIECFRRMVARRGLPSNMYSDRGTNFVGTDSELKRMIKQHHQTFTEIVSQQGTNWKFNTSAPHQGGLWEAAVKSAKHHLKRIIGVTPLTLEQFQTILCNVEACLNSRPICSLSSDPMDVNALTPGHFLIGEPLITIPEGDVTDIPDNRLDHWQQSQQISQHWWNRWKSEYLSELQRRQKWQLAKPNLAVGDLVLIRDEGLPPTKWKLGRVLKTHIGEDQLVRNVTLVLAKEDYIARKREELVRPIHKLSLIMSNDEQDCHYFDS